MAAPWVKREASVSLTQVLLGANVMVFIAMVIATAAHRSTSPDKVMDALRRQLRPLHLVGRVVATASPTCFCMAASCISPSTCGACGIWGAVRISLRSLDFRRHLSDHGGFRRLGERGLESMMPSVGASGAIFGLAGALIASFYLGEFSPPELSSFEAS